MDEIAARARAGKGALYRRWPSKAALVVDAVNTWRNTRAPNALPDTGSLLGDIEATIALVPEFDEVDRRNMGVVAGLASAASRDPELRAALNAYILERPRRLIGGLLQRAVERGEIDRAR